MSMGARFIRIAVIYFVLAVILGITMGIIQKFELTTVHAHLNLLGWVSLAIVGLIYHHYPRAGENKLARVHFWLHNLGLPIMQGSLFIMMTTGNHGVVVAAIIGSLMLGLGVLLFACNIWRHVRA